MDIDDEQRLRTNPDYNFYIISTARPNAQLFAVRAEWEIEETETSQDSQASKVHTEAEAEEYPDEGFHIAAVQFAGLPHLVVGLPRSTHDQVLSLAEQLDFNVVLGHPMTNNRDHFPLEASEDSIFTLETRSKITKQKLKALFRTERKQIKKYLAARDKEEEDIAAKSTEHDPAIDVILLP